MASRCIEFMPEKILQDFAQYAEGCRILFMEVRVVPHIRSSFPNTKLSIKIAGFPSATFHKIIVGNMPTRTLIQTGHQRISSCQDQFFRYLISLAIQNFKNINHVRVLVYILNPLSLFPDSIVTGSASNLTSEVMQNICVA
jgi:hypothetical protein